VALKSFAPLKIKLMLEGGAVMEYRIADERHINAPPLTGNESSADRWPAAYKNVLLPKEYSNLDDGCCTVLS
jgi:hypothetical protein